MCVSRAHLRLALVVLLRSRLRCPAGADKCQEVRVGSHDWQLVDFCVTQATVLLDARLYPVHF